MNIPSFELGWIITDKANFRIEDSVGFFEQLKDPTGDYEVPGTADLNRGYPLTFETHPLKIERVFVTMHELEHGFTDFAEPADLGKLVRDAVGRDYDVDWGVIETGR